MKIAVLGSGQVGRTLAVGLARVGHDVALASRQPSAPDVAAWSATTRVPVALPADIARGADVLVNATPGDAAVAAVAAAGGADLTCVLLDVSNPLDFSGGAPAVFTAPDDSIGEQLQLAFPTLRVVKSLCTVNCAVMVDPAALAEPTTMFVAGNDAEAKAIVTSVLTDLGWLPGHILDLGGIEASRELERNILFWLRHFGAVGSAVFNIRLVGPAG